MNGTTVVQAEKNAGGPGEIPRFVTYTSPVSLAPGGDGANASHLPLNIIALIVSFLEDIADVARVTRTCRLLYYMTLPQLYQKVHLHSYPEIRYVNGRPEGFGSGSPFTMALNGLITKTHANLVQEFRIWGEWNELGVDDFAKGRVPENSMMLNILLRASTDRMAKLRSFSWELNCKPLKTLYQGLATHNTLTSLIIKFPSSRLPRPAVMIPPMPQLRAFRAMDIDPLCYPDDISMLLLGSKHIEDLRLHFSPRMRQEAESSLSLETYFGRCIRANYRLQLKHFALQNFYGANTLDLSTIMDHEKAKSMVFLDVFGGMTGNSRNVFLDDTWKEIPKGAKPHFKIVRCNEVAQTHVELITISGPMERMYFVSSRARTGQTPPTSNFTPDGVSIAPVTPAGETPPDSESSAALGKSYLYALTRHHGSTLKHLLLYDQWALTIDDIADLVRYCPNLEQLGVGVNDISTVQTLRLLIPFLPKLFALRILSNDWANTYFRESPPENHLDDMGVQLEKSGTKKMKWVGIGDRIFHIGPSFVDEADGVRKREIKEASVEDVSHVAIWRLDCMDLGIDEGAAAVG